MSTAKKEKQASPPQVYAPKTMPEIVSMAQQMQRKGQSSESVVQVVNPKCSIVDRDEIKVVGLRIAMNAESSDHVFGIAEKYIRNGTLRLIAELVGAADEHYVGVCTDIAGAGQLTYIVGVETPSFANLPEALPENTVTITCPAGRFAKVDAAGDQMATYEYFVNKFRQETEYVYDRSHLPCHFYAPDGKLTAVYEPVKAPANSEERFESVDFEVVSLPELKCACKMGPLGDGHDVIAAYFAAQPQVVCLPVAKRYLNEYLGFPYRRDGVVYSCFGSRVEDFTGLPDCVEQLTVPAGLYLHIKQMEFNGDNPSMLYEVCFKHLDELFLKRHSEYKFDKNRFVIARFLLGTSSSLFAPIVRG